MKINFGNAKKHLGSQTGKKVIAVNGCCFGNKKNKNPEKDGYYKICGQEFWQLVSGSESFYIDIIKPIGHKAKQRNEEFLEVYSVVVNKFTLEFAQRFCIDGKIEWGKIIGIQLRDKGEINNVKPTVVDVFVEDNDGALFLFDIKTVKPNMGFIL